MSLEQALRAVGAGANAAKSQAPLAAAAMIAGGITTQRRASFFLAQVAHESAGFYYREEIASGQGYEGRRDLGNIHPGDGRKFKGRGWIQLTGRANYRAAGKALGIDLERHPDRAKESAIAWRIAVWYWSTRKLNAICDDGNFELLTRRINGGLNGYSDRKRRLELLRNIDCSPKPVRPIRLTKDEAAARRVLLHERKIADRAGGFSEVHNSHRVNAEKAKAFLVASRKDLLARKVDDRDYQRRKAAYLQDLARRTGRFRKK